MLTHTIQTISSGRKLTAKLCLLLIFLSTSIGFAQPIQLSEDSIHVVDEEVVFSVKFTHDLSKEEFFGKSSYYLNNKLDPYSGAFTANNEDATTCIITDYLDVESNSINTYAMYVTYTLHLEYKDGYCNMTISDITYMEKGYFETQEKSQRKLNMPKFSGKDVMIDKKFTWLLKRNSSEKVTKATIERFNEIIKNLDSAFSAK